MSDDLRGFVGSVPENYDRGLGPIVFADYAEHTARLVAGYAPSRVLETVYSMLGGLGLRKVVASTVWQLASTAGGDTAAQARSVPRSLSTGVRAGRGGRTPGR